MYAAALVRELKAIDPTVEVFGFGGDRLRAVGADLIGNYRGLSVTGLSEALPVLSRAWAMLKRLREAAADRRPDVFVAIDFPDFNFRLLAPMRALGIKVVYYVSPQLWAWRPKRLETIRRTVNRVLVIFPFEREIYEKAGVPVEFVGHPLVEMTATTTSRDAFLRSVGLDPGRPVLALLPGSRSSELRHVLPTMVAAAPLIASRVPGVQFLVARAPSLDDALFAPLSAVTGAGLPLGVAHEATDDVLAAADAVVTASGTATIQAALHGTPMVVVYRLSAMTYAIGRQVVRVTSYGMVNLVAGRQIVPELIQDGFTPEAVADEAASLLTDGGRADTMRRDLADVRAALGGPGASRRAAIGVGAFFHRFGTSGAGGRSET